jgi:hypothetical protein|uniref:Unclassified n=2 Tax=Fusarium pseudograminearum TaxID=101028 RepID=W1IAQ2_FUSPS|nr:unclassified [Fusarium pseudograminearum CS3220]CDL73121.1 unclassified [Fusarium pseudograminearum CS3427]CDX48426.1 unclassified [Fusarium pseudograminearum CS3427]CDX48512.1 unclassified [Fusarium pseudograminearum CS3220]
MCKYQIYPFTICSANTTKQAELGSFSLSSNLWLVVGITTHLKDNKDKNQSLGVKILAYLFAS